MKYFLIPLLFVFFLSSCDRTRTSTGWDYMPDMYYSEAYESYAPNQNFTDGLNMRTPVEGTIPRGMIPFQYEKTEADRLRAGEELKNPMALSPESLAAGKKAYDIFCINCHGINGDGQGFLYTSKRYPYPPASLINEKLIDMSDGEIYHAITLGYGVMGAHGAMISQEDRWQIITYIRQELQK